MHVGINARPLVRTLTACGRNLKRFVPTLRSSRSFCQGLQLLSRDSFNGDGVSVGLPCSVEANRVEIALAEVTYIKVISDTQAGDLCIFRLCSGHGDQVSHVIERQEKIRWSKSLPQKHFQSGIDRAAH